MSFFKQLTCVVLMALLALPPSSVYAGNNGKSKEEKTQDILGLIEKPYSELFRSVGENYKLDKSAWGKAQDVLRQNKNEKVGGFDARIAELEQKRTALRQERKIYNDEIIKIKVQIERLEEKIYAAKEDKKDVSAFEKEIEVLAKSAEEPTRKSNELKCQLDGDTTFDVARARERLENMQDALDSGTPSEFERKRLESEIKKLEAEIKAATGLNGKIRNIQREKYLFEAKDSHKFSKLNALKRWPKKLKKIRDTIMAGKQDERKYGNVEEIGDLEKREMSRVKVLKILPGLISKNSEIQMGREFAQELLRNIKAHESEKITEYVNRLGQNLVRNSDSWCPFTFYTIADPPGMREINAFALPGGQVFVHDTLILAMKSEGELAGVLAHEIAHVTARHSAKMLSKYQYMQYGALFGIIFGGIGYWGYQGIGMLMNIGMLGITRESESEADLLGTQYLWKAGYYPPLLEESFERLLKYAKLGGSSFWRTHPSLDDRMERVEEESRYLPPHSQYITDSKEFSEIQRLVRDARMEINKDQKKKEEKDRDKTLKRPGEGGEEPETPPVLKRKPLPQDDEDKAPEDPSTENQEKPKNQ